MKLLSHQGLDHVAGELQSRLVNGGGLDLATSGFCLHAFRELMKPLLGLRRVRMLLPSGDPESWEIQGGARDRSFRNKLQTRWLAAQALRWLRESVELRIAPSRLPQSLLLVRSEAIKVYAKLPGWFRVPTPLGAYNPDWAVLVQRDGGERLYLVVETKSSLFADDLRDVERGKIRCGQAHFREVAGETNPARFLTASKVEEVLDGP